jgi:hypothetical protein
MLPNWNTNLPVNDMGLDAYFASNGIDPNTIMQLKADPNGLAKAIGLVNQNAAAATGTQSNVPANPAATQVTDEAPRRVSRRTPKNLEATARGLAGGATAGGGPGGGVKGVKLREGADGALEIEMRFRKAVEDAAAQAAAGGTTPAPQPGGTPNPPPAPKALPTFEEAVEARAQRKYIDKGKVPPPWNSTMTFLERNSPAILGGTAGLAGLGALGGGAALATRLMGGGDKPQENAGGVTPGMIMPAVPDDRAKYLQLQRLERLGIPVQQPPNPAGMPPDDNSTLLMRVMNSRNV